jgi:hypothetical protein
MLNSLGKIRPREKGSDHEDQWVGFAFSTGGRTTDIHFLVKNRLGDIGEMPVDKRQGHQVLLE